MFPLIPVSWKAWGCCASSCKDSELSFPSLPLTVGSLGTSWHPGWWLSVVEVASAVGADTNHSAYDKDRGWARSSAHSSQDWVDFLVSQKVERAPGPESEPRKWRQVQLETKRTGDTISPRIKHFQGAYINIQDSSKIFTVSWRSWFGEMLLLSIKWKCHSSASWTKLTVLICPPLGSLRHLN